MNSKIFKNFTKDISDLYCATKIASIEDCFIRLSEVSNGIDAISLIRWLNVEKKSKGTNSIRRQIATPELFDVFEYLYSLLSRIKSIQGDLSKFRIEVFNQNPKFIEIINTMNDLLKDYSARSILYPFEPAISLVSRVFPIPAHNEEMIKKDIQLIAQVYESRLAEQEESIKNLFIILLDRFSQDVGQALIDVGRKDLSDKITSGKILYRPDLLSKVIQVGHVDFVMGDKIRNMISHIIYESRTPEASYQYIKKEALDFVGVIDKKQYGQEQDENKMQEDLTSLQKGSPLPNTKPNLINITSSQLLQPRSLAIISAILYALYLKVSV